MQGRYFSIEDYKLSQVQRSCKHDPPDEVRTMLLDRDGPAAHQKWLWMETADVIAGWASWMLSDERDLLGQEQE